MRVTRTETNMAYRAADNARWEQLDFILGIHIQPSESHPQPDICDMLAGDYPKTFKFAGWHPQCFCIMTPILPKDDELVAMADARFNGEEYEPETAPVTEYPKGFKDFVQDNAENIRQARLRGTEPYFLRDNQSVVDNIIQGGKDNPKSGKDWDWRAIIHGMPTEDAEEEVYQFLKDMPVRERRALMKEHEEDFNGYLVKLIEDNQDKDYPEFLQLNYSLYRELESSVATPEDLKKYFHEGYKSGFYKQYNAALREGRNIHEELTSALDKLTNSGTLPTDMMLHRFTDAKYLSANFGITEGMTADEIIAIIQKRKGSVIADKAFTSTSAVLDNNVMEYQGVKIKILAPKGTKAFISDNFDESEILLPRGQKFEIVGVSKYHNVQGKDSVELVLKLQNEATTQSSILERAAQRHTERTSQEIADIQMAWNQRNSSNVLIDHLQRFGDFDYHYEGSIDENSFYKHWEILTNEQRLNVLTKGRFTGMISSEEDLDFANIYRPTTKNDMVGTLQEVLMNAKDGFNMEDENHYVYHFKNGKKIFFSEDVARPLSKTDLERLDFLTASGGLSNYRYWTADEKAKAEMMQHMGFIEYREGRVVSSWNGKDFLGNALSDQYIGQGFIEKGKDYIISKRFAGLKTHDEVAKTLRELLGKRLGYDVEIEIDANLIDLSTTKAYATRLESLTRRYNLKQAKLAKIKLGYMPSDDLEMGKTHFDGKSPKSVQITNKNDLRYSDRTGNTSRCDKDRLHVSTLTHEFGHLLYQIRETCPKEYLFLEASIKSEYEKYIRDFYSSIKDNNMEALHKISLGARSIVSVNEFIAEAFQEYLNCKNPTPYATKIGKMLDSYFKR